MTEILVALLAFGAMAFGAWFGMRLASALPDHHLSQDSKEAVRIGMALIASLTALVLGLIVAAAKNSFDEQNQAVRHAATDILTMDRALADYGTETRACRDALRRLVGLQLDHIWAEGPGAAASADPAAPPAGLDSGARAIEAVDACVRQLAPGNDGQRVLQARALSLCDTLQEARWLRLESNTAPIPTAFLVIVVFWLTVLFWSFGLFAPRNSTVRAVIVLCALSTSAAIYLILELEHPFDGSVRVASDPMHYTLTHLGE